MQCLVSFSKLSREVVVGGALQEREVVSGQTALGQACRLGSLLVSVVDGEMT